MATRDVSSDLEKARLYLEQDAAVKVVAVKDGRVLGSEAGQGIVPLLRLVDRLGAQFEGSCVADRVIGRAAGFLLIAAKARAAYTQTLSAEAQALLQNHDIPVHGATLVPYIETPDRSGRCVMERQVLGVDDAHEAVGRLRAFLSK